MKTPKISLGDQIIAAKKLERVENWGEWAFWLYVKCALHAGDVEGLVKHLRVLSKARPDPEVGRAIAQTLDNLAAMLEIGLLAFNQKKGRGRPTGSRLERSLQRAKNEYDRLRKYGLLVGITSDGKPKFDRVTREKALDIAIINNNGYVKQVERRREELSLSGKKGPTMPPSYCRITRDQLLAQIDGKRPSARRYLKRQSPT